MIANAQTSYRATFGIFEVDLKSGELRKAGYRVKLQGLPFKVLAVLLENAGEVVTQEELQIRVWGPDVSVEFEQSLYTCIRKIREALADSADSPRYIETLSRRGFRFIAPVKFTDAQSEGSADSTLDASTQIPVAENGLSIGQANVTTESVSPVQGWNRFRLPALYSGVALCFGLAGLLGVCRA
jgi:DNA-binding winged helix-turn-helix (wHTH) protein